MSLLSCSLKSFAKECTKLLATSSLPTHACSGQVRMPCGPSCSLCREMTWSKNKALSYIASTFVYMNQLSHCDCATSNKQANLNKCQLKKKKEFYMPKPRSVREACCSSHLGFFTMHPNHGTRAFLPSDAIGMGVPWLRPNPRPCAEYHTTI